MTASVPLALAALGKVLIPIPPGEKGIDRPRTDETLLPADDPVLNASLESGHNYAIACRGDVAVADADEPVALEGLTGRLPETLWRFSGSRTSEYIFLRVPGLDEDIPLDDPETGANLGHIKAAEQSYVVGPGSRHPSGNSYGPLHGNEIATVNKDDLLELLEPWTRDRDRDRHPNQNEHGHCCGDTVSSTGVDDVSLDVYDVLSSVSFPEETRVEHPFHGSSMDAISWSANVARPSAAGATARQVMRSI